MEQMLKDTPHTNSLAEFLIANCHDILGTAESDREPSALPADSGAHNQSDAASAVPQEDSDNLHLASGEHVGAADASRVALRVIPKTWTERQFLDLGVTRSDAESLLDDIGVDGTFVVRASYFPDPGGRPRSDSAVGYSVTCYHAGSTHHARILVFEGNLTLGEVGFSNLAQLVRHYQSVPLPCGQRLRYPVTRFVVQIMCTVDFRFLFVHVLAIFSVAALLVNVCTH
jgi:hypothetical protein